MKLLTLALLLALLAMALLLTACGQKVVYQPVEVKVPVSVPCKAPIVPEPNWPTKELKKGDPVFRQVQMILAEIELRKGYEAQLRASIMACQ